MDAQTSGHTGLFIRHVARTAKVTEICPDGFTVQGRRRRV